MITDEQAVQLMRMYVASLDRPALMETASGMLAQFVRQAPDDQRGIVREWLWQWFDYYHAGAVPNFTNENVEKGSA